MAMWQSYTRATRYSSNRTAGDRCWRAEPLRCSYGATVCGKTPAGIWTRVAERNHLRVIRALKGRLGHCAPPEGREEPFRARALAEPALQRTVHLRTISAFSTKRNPQGPAYERTAFTVHSSADTQD